MQSWSIGAFILVAICLLLFMVGASSLLGEGSAGHAKNRPFESGIVGAGSGRMRFDMRFYLVAMLFVVFDVEALYLYGWAAVLRKVGWSGWVGAASFIAILLVGLIYDVRLGVLDWAPVSRHKNSKNGEARLQATNTGFRELDCHKKGITLSQRTSRIAEEGEAGRGV